MATYPDQELRELMDEYELDEETAQRAQELVDAGLDHDEAIELADEL
jgi:hypothetical protein